MGVEQEQNRVSEISENENSKQNLNDIKSEEFLQKNSENTDLPNKELLGSVTVQNCPGVRTSARVIQKMKQDSVRCTSPPLHDKKDYSKEEKNLQRTSRTASKNVWSNLEKNLFFDALNECGKDFDAIYNFINSKIKKSSSDQSMKTKEQIRHSYYQTFHKLSKYIKFSDEVRKPVQELYTLINYGEMRRRLAFISEKNLMKIRELVYKGHITIRNKGRSVRIKTPSCKALRKLNQLEGWLDDIKLPSKVEVCLRPATMEAWGRVQNIAQNPVVRTVVPLQKKLINIIKTFQLRWRSQDTKMNETALTLFGTGTSSTINETPKCDRIEIDQNQQHQNNFNDEPLICLAPQKDATIHRPLVSVTQYLSSFNICLNSYEERMGIKIRGETLCQDRSYHNHHNKRQRTDSGCEKKNSPENKKFRTETTPPSDAITKSSLTAIDITPEKCLLNNDSDNHNSKDYRDETEDDLCGEELLSELFMDERQIIDCVDSYNHKNEVNSDDGMLHSNYESVSSNNCSISVNSSGAKICSSSSPSDVNKTVKKYSKKKDRDTKKDVNNLKPLISDEIIRRVRNGWTVMNAADITVGDLYIVFGLNSKLMFEYYWLNDRKPEFDSSVPYYSSTIRNDNDMVDKIYHNSLSNKLKHLLLIANLSERMKRKQCTCGHICGAKTKQAESDVSAKSFVSNITYSASHSDVNVFRQPVLPLRRPLAVQSFKQVPNGHRVKQSRFLRTGKIGSRQIVVQRLLPVQPGINQSFDVVTPQLEIRTVQDDDAASIADVAATGPLTIENDTNDSDNIHYETATLPSTQVNGTDFIKEIFASSNSEENADVEIRAENEIVSESTKCTVGSTNNGTITNQELDPDLNPLLDLSLPSPLPISSLDENTNDTLTSIPPMSPMQLLRESSGDSKWLDENIGDFSLTSFLGHLDEINNREASMDNANISVISESSVDYVSKFAEIASLQNEERDL